MAKELKGPYPEMIENSTKKWDEICKAFIKKKESIKNG